MVGIANDAQALVLVRIHPGQQRVRMARVGEWHVVNPRPQEALHYQDESHIRASQKEGTRGSVSAGEVREGASQQERYERERLRKRVREEAS